MSSILQTWRRILLALTFASSAAVAGAADVRPFTSQSFREVRAANSGRPLVVAFWSVNCEPCKEEMALLTRLHRAFPSVRIVVVAADAPELRPVVLRFLARYSLGRIEAWQFGDEPDERLRYSVDHAWRGELPRSYFVNAAGEMTTQSGLPEGSWAEEWFRQASAPAAKPSHE